jgi:hypothetical protein
MSHPGEISCRCNRTISRILRRMRLRFTAFPSAFLMLQPNRLASRPFERRKTANSRLDRRRPSRYTASNSDRRTRRQARGNSFPGGSDARETVAPFSAACRKYFSSTLALHPCAEAVFFMTAAHMWLISAFRQRSFSSAFRSISLFITCNAPYEFRFRNAAPLCRESRAGSHFVAPPFRRQAVLVDRDNAPKRNNESRRPPHTGQGTLRLGLGSVPIYLASIHNRTHSDEFRCSFFMF